MNEVRTPIHVMAFTEHSALAVYVANESAAPLAILNDLDAINVPQGPAPGVDEPSDADLVHIDFGVSGSGSFVEVAPGECVKITLLLRPEQLDLLARARCMKTAVKYRAGGDEGAEVKTELLPARVYTTRGV